jgi:hypothetical protein
MKIKALFLCSLALGLLSASAVERGYLSYQHVSSGDSYTYDDEVVTLAAGDSIGFTYINSNSYAKRFEIILPDESTFMINTNYLGFDSSGGVSALPQKISGPCTVRLSMEGSSSSQLVYAAYEITRRTEVTSSLPSNSVVIPTDATGDVEIILESSVDLVSWTAATAGTYGSSTEKRFFRVRAVAQ